MCRVQNWNDYNNFLINRGRINFWINKETEGKWQENSYSGFGFGRPKFFSDVAITIKEMSGFNIEIPHYTTLCRRQKTLKINIPKIKPTSEVLIWQINLLCRQN
jgi:hypothetical protein